MTEPRVSGCYLRDNGEARWSSWHHSMRSGPGSAFAMHESSEVSRAAMIEASAVGKTYYATKDRSVEALSAIDLSINDGEFVSIVGPSGCGKSTFLSLVAGLIPATGGSLKVASKVVT